MAIGYIIRCLVTKWRRWWRRFSCAVSSLVVALVARRKRRRLRSCWVRDWLHKRPQHATHVSLLSSLRSSDPSTYRNFLPDGPWWLRWAAKNGSTCHNTLRMGDMYPLVSSLHLHLATQVDTNRYMYPKYFEQCSTRGYKWIQVHFVSDTDGYK